MRSFCMIGRAGFLLAALAACGGGDGPTEPVASDNSISFSYSGAASGSFAVSGVPGPGADGASAFSFDGEPPMLVVGGVKMHSASRAAFMNLILPAVTAPRSFSLSDDACLDFNAVCPLALFAPDMAAGPPSLIPDADLEEVYLFTGGTVVVTFVSAARVAGTFSGTAQNTPLNNTPAKTITVSNGKFDVTITPLEDSY